MLDIGVVTLFPDMVNTVTRYGVTGRAVERGLVKLRTWNPRDFTSDRHRTVDDRPYGGGPGMVMLFEPLAKAITAAVAALGANVHVLAMTPQGRCLNQSHVADLARFERMVIVSGRYEGIDERIVERFVTSEWSIGDYVVSGGELPAMVLIDAMARTVPGCLGHADSAQQDSFFDGLLDCPHYTRPEEVAGLRVPEVLLSGNHEQIRRWRLQQSIGRTWERRRDLLSQREVSGEEKILLEQYLDERRRGTDTVEAVNESTHQGVKL